MKKNKDQKRAKENAKEIHIEAETHRDLLKSSKWQLFCISILNIKDIIKGKKNLVKCYEILCDKEMPKVTLSSFVLTICCWM